MEEDVYKPRVPDLMEAVFDIGYLTFDLIAGILFFAFSRGRILFILYGILTLTLCARSGTTRIISTMCARTASPSSCWPMEPRWMSSRIGMIRWAISGSTPSAS